MKKYFYLLMASLTALTTNVFSQTIPNAGFENWTNHTLYEDPPPFGTFNLISYISNGKSVVSKSTDKHGGNYAALLTVDSFATGTALGSLLLGSGGGFSFAGGVPYNKRPDSLVGYFKYEFPAGDSAQLLIGFKKAGTYMSFSDITIKGTKANYKRISFPITYFMAGNPDTLFGGILILSANNNPSKIKLYVDDLSFVGTGVPAFPNGDFETWSPVTSEDPDGWSTSNLYTFNDGVSVAKTTDKKSGSLAAQLTTQVAFSSGEPFSFLINGRLGFNNGQGGLPVSMIPMALTGFYKAAPQGNDTGVAIVRFTKWNSTTMQTDSVAEFLLHLSAKSNYTPFTLSIPNFPGNPDTVLVGFSASDLSDSLASHTVGSTLNVDDISFQFANGLTIPVNEYFRVNVLYPNPATENVSLNYSLDKSSDVTVMIYDVSGKVVKEVSLGKKDKGESQFTLNVKDLSAGTYFYSFNAGEKETVKKFTIAR